MIFRLIASSIGNIISGIIESINTNLRPWQTAYDVDGVTSHPNTTDVTDMIANEYHVAIKPLCNVKSTLKIAYTGNSLYYSNFYYFTFHYILFFVIIYSSLWFHHICRIITWILIIPKLCTVLDVHGYLRHSRIVGMFYHLLYPHNLSQILISPL